MAIRKDANSLSSAERTELVNAILTLKAQGVYDQFVLRHANAVMSAIHRCPAFLPWHRRYLWDFERELQRVSGNPTLGVPYWNWPEGGSGESMWNDELLGGNGNAITQVVTDGPFREGQWRIVNSSGVAVGPLTRAFGRQDWAATLPTHAEIDQVLQVTPFDTSPWTANSNPSFRNQIEGFIGPNLHNRGHGWVGGSMLPMTSPNDPVFFMHHCMVDKLWHEWQLRFPNQGYHPMNGGPFGQNLNDPMDSTPVGAIGNRPIDVLDSTALDIEYDALIPGTPTPTPGPIIIPPDAALVVNGASITRAIANAGEVDTYSFAVTSFGNYIIETSGSSDTVVTLSGPDNASNELSVNDDGGANLNSRISMNLSVGIYTVRVRLFSANETGNYGLSVSLANTAPITPTPEPTPDGTLVINGASITRSIANAGEVDIYTFDVTSFGTYAIETSGSSDTVVTLSGPDNASNELSVNDDGGDNRNSRISMNLAVGSYTVRVRLFSADATGDYGISVSSNTAPLIPVLAVDGPLLDAFITFTNESDLYRFEATSQANYVIETSGQTDTFMTLLGPGSQTTLIAENDDGGFNLSSRISRSLSSGEYFVRVRHFSPQGTGAYQIRVRRL